MPLFKDEASESNISYSLEDMHRIRLDGNFPILTMLEYFGRPIEDILVVL